MLYTRSNQPGGWFGVEIAFGALVRVEVLDLGGAGSLIGRLTRRPDNRDLEAEPDGLPDDPAGISLGGRGLAIVAELAVTTGACGSDALGHFVWADLALPEPDEEVTIGKMTLLAS